MKQTRGDLLHLLQTTLKSPTPRSLIHMKMEVKRQLAEGPTKKENKKKSPKRSCQSALYINDKFQRRKCKLKKIVKMYNENEPKNISSQANLYINPNINLSKTVTES